MSHCSPAETIPEPSHLSPSTLAHAIPRHHVFVSMLSPRVGVCPRAWTQFSQFSHALNGTTATYTSLSGLLQAYSAPDGTGLSADATVDPWGLMALWSFLGIECGKKSTHASPSLYWEPAAAPDAQCKRWGQKPCHTILRQLRVRPLNVRATLQARLTSC